MRTPSRVEVSLAAALALALLYCGHLRAALSASPKIEERVVVKTEVREVVRRVAGPVRVVEKIVERPGGERVVERVVERAPVETTREAERETDRERDLAVAPACPAPRTRIVGLTAAPTGNLAPVLRGGVILGGRLAVSAGHPLDLKEFSPRIDAALHF